MGPVGGADGVRGAIHIIGPGAPVNVYVDESRGDIAVPGIEDDVRLARRPALGDADDLAAGALDGAAFEDLVGQNHAPGKSNSCNAHANQDIVRGMERKEKARELLASQKTGALSTQSKKVPGYPFGSLVNYAVDGAGRPVFLFSALAVHSKNLAEDPRASLLVFGPAALEDPLTSARMTVFGTIAPVPEAEHEEAIAVYLGAHPSAAEYLEFGDFQPFRLETADIYFVGGFGEMGWI